VIDYFTGKMKVQTTLHDLFVPASGTFYINLLLQKALLKNTLDLFRIANLVYYAWKMRFTRSWWSQLGIRRYLTPLQRLKWAELNSVYIEEEYSYMHWVMSICFAYCLWSPLVLLATLLYSVYKYLIDRRIILHVYAHRRHSSIHGAAFGTASDFISHHKMAVMNVSLVLVNMTIFAFYQAAFYGSKIRDDSRFIVHTIVNSLMGLILGSLIPIIRYTCTRYRHQIIEHGNFKNHSCRKVTSKTVSKWYDPATTFEFLNSI
jgi:hypothetical protein